MVIGMCMFSYVIYYMGVSCLDVPEPGSLSQGYVSLVCFGGVFPGMFRAPLLKQEDKNE